MTTVSPSDQSARVFFLGTPSHPVALDRWTALQEQLGASGVETTTDLDGEIDYAIVHEDILDGYCSVAEALALQKLRARGITCASSCAGPEQILAALAAASSEFAPVVPISTAKGRIFGRSVRSAV
ncbi:hypothetical protein [Rhodococcus sp. NPDC047139]|uniref:hypothetical protein n=1 Tax=Rhodococcus sp. NPDC047139 TaxID=3155141 RepID=UPI00340962B1